MSGDSKKLQPIIIKRVKKGGHAVHGGAWKIAYADFVTAMMAFFLLMWLLGSTTDGDKKGIADYFQSPLKVALLSTGSGSGDASHVLKGGGTDLSRTSGSVKKGDIQAKPKTINLAAMKAERRGDADKQDGIEHKGDSDKLEGVQNHISDILQADPKLAGLGSQVRFDMTRDGLRIQITDDQSRPMFDSGSAIVKPYMRDLLRVIGLVLSEVPNRLTLEGHTDATPFAADQVGIGYGNWELSADRANASRRELVAAGLPPERVLRILGLASSMPFEGENPQSPTNRRISIIVMNREAEERLLQNASSSMVVQSVNGGSPGSDPDTQAPVASPLSNSGRRTP